MNNYTDRDGNPWTMNQTRSRLSQDMYADLVAAIEIARAYQAKCERLERWKAEATDVIGRWEAVYEAAGIDPAGNLGRKKSDLLAEELQRLRDSEDNLSQTIVYLQRKAKQ